MSFYKPYDIDPVLEPSDLFEYAEVEHIDGGVIDINQCAIKGESELRISIRFQYEHINDHGGRCYGVRDIDTYSVRYMKIPFTDPISLSNSLVACAKERYGDAYFEYCVSQLTAYLRNDVTDQINSDNQWNEIPNFHAEDFPYACQLVLIVALRNPEEWKSRGMRREIQRCLDSGHDGIHLELAWAPVDFPDVVHLRLYNSGAIAPVNPSANRPIIQPLTLIEFAETLSE